MNCFVGFLFFVLSAVAAAEMYQYELKGSFKIDSSRQRPVDYTLRWSEENGRITGIYSDTFYSKSAQVSGEGNDLGRTFIVKFPQVKTGVHSLTLLSSLAKGEAQGTSIPVSLTTRDSVGNPLTTVKAKANFATTSYRTVAQLQEENRCTEGFGVLAGYCGLYAGLLAEEQDRRNKCNLLFSDAVRLELTQDATVILHLGEVNELITTPGHSIGRLPVNPQKSSVDLLGRVCGPLSGVNSSSTSCKQLHLKGGFSTIRESKHFSGTYTISEEGTNNICRYSLSMDKLQVDEAK